MMLSPNHTVFFVSDGTGITAETFGNSILNQFAVKPRHVRRPFVDSVDKAHQVVREINHAAEVEGKRPVVFITLVDRDVLAIVKDLSKGLVLVEPPRGALLGRGEEPGVHRPHRGDQLLARP